MTKPFHDQTNLRLEVQADPTGLPNLVLNPSGVKGAWFWVTPVANTVMTSNGSALTFKTTVAQACNFTSDYMPVAATKYVTARFDLTALTASHNVKVTFDWYNAAKALLSSSSQTTAFTALATNYTPTVQAPANTAYVKIRFNFYNGTGNPSANAAVTFSSAMVTWQDAGTVSTTRTNLVRNPSFEVDTYAWLAEVGSIARSTAQAAVGGASLACTRSVAGVGTIEIRTSTVGGVAIPVTGGATYSVQARTRPASTARTFYLGFRWFDASLADLWDYNEGATETPGAWTTFQVTATAPAAARYAAVTVSWIDATNGEVHYLDAVSMVKATTAGAYFDGTTADTASFDYGWTGTAHASTSTETTLNGTFEFSEPYAWRNILGPTFGIKIDRHALDVGTLTAQISDPLLDPANTDDVRPGKLVRLSALAQPTAGGTPVWTVLYEGRILNAPVDYNRTKEPGAVDTTIITITALDAISTLANRGESRGYETIAALPYILEDKGVPWNVNGSGNQYQGTPTQVSANADASVLDQIAITRDTARGCAWVDRANVLNVFDAASLDTTLRARFSDVPTPADPVYDSYSSIDVDFDTARCINEVTVKWLRYNAAQGTSEEVTYGPYRDQTSIDTWGPYAAEFTIHGASESSANIAAFAAAVLAANATPVRRCNGLTMPVVDARSLGHAANVDLYSRVHVDYSDKINADYRVTSLTHEITPAKWTVDYGFEVTGSVAAPTMVPSPPGAMTASPKSGVFAAVGTATSWTGTVTFAGPPFAAAPSVTVTPKNTVTGTQFIVIQVTSITTTGFTWRALWNDSFSHTSAGEFCWHARELTQ